jgi:hypothetical protein
MELPVIKYILSTKVGDLNTFFHLSSSDMTLVTGGSMLPTEYVEDIE